MPPNHRVQILLSFAKILHFDLPGRIAMSTTQLLTSESVSEGHPDKVADQISDSILDALLAQDPHCRVACETLVKMGMVLIAGEISTTAWVDIEKQARTTIKEIGYTDPQLGFDADSCAVLTAIGKQSPDISRGVDQVDTHQLGAGDQGMMIGYACNETDVLMPAPITYAHRLMRRQAELRKEGVLPWLRPDAKAQVTIRYENGRPCGADSVVLSTQHNPDIKQAALIEAVIEEIIKPVFPSDWINADTTFHINPTGRFVIVQPQFELGQHLIGE